MTQKRLSYIQTIASFCVGASLTCLILIYYSHFPHYLFCSKTAYKLLCGPWIEEGLKFISALLLIRFAYFTSSSIPFIGLGFGFMEQLAYFINRNDFTDKRIIVVWLHVVLGLIMGYFFYLAKKTKYLFLRIIYYILALYVPVVLHLAWNMLGTIK